MLLAATLPPLAIVGIVLGAILLLAAAMVTAGYIAFYMVIVNPKENNPDKPNKFMGDDFPEFVKDLVKYRVELKEREHQSFEVTTDDGLTLRGDFFFNPTPGDVTIVCLHGYTSNGYNEYGKRAAYYLNSGYNVLLANHRRHGPSDGKYVGFGVLDRHDVLKWVEAAEKFVPDSKIFISGVSMGAATAMQCADLGLPKSVKGIIEDCGFTTMAEEVAATCKTAVGFTPRLLIKIMGWFVKHLAGYGMTDADSRKSLAASDLPLLVIHGDDDKMVPTSMGYEVYEACNAPKEILILKGVGHAQSYHRHAEECTEAVDKFIAKYK